MNLFGIKVGERKAQEAAESVLRGGQLSELIVAQGLAKYAELARQGRLFVGATAAGGVAPGTAIGTTGPFTLANPAGSGVRLVVCRASMGYLSGTLGAGMVVYAANLNTIAAAVTGTAITVSSCLLGSQAQARGKAFTTATLPANPTILRPFCNLDAELATSVVGLNPVIEDVDGEFILEPGAALTLQGIAAAGTSPLVIFGMTWAEYPIS